MEPFFPVTAGILATALSGPGGIGVYTSPGPITVSKEEEERAGRLSLEVTAPSIFTDVSVRRASPLSSVLVTRAILATALVTTLVTRFSSNRYVFL